MKESYFLLNRVLDSLKLTACASLFPFMGACILLWQYVPLHDDYLIQLQAPM